MSVVMLEVAVPVVRCPTCQDAYNLIAPITPPRWIYSQPAKCKRAKHPLAIEQGVELAKVETLPVRAIVRKGTIQ